MNNVLGPVTTDWKKIAKKGLKTLKGERVHAAPGMPLRQPEASRNDVIKTTKILAERDGARYNYRRMTELQGRIVAAMHSQRWAPLAGATVTQDAQRRAVILKLGSRFQTEAN